MKTAFVFAECSNATRLKVGAVVVRDNSILACGYNAQPKHIDRPCEDKEFKLSTSPEFGKSPKDYLMDTDFPFYDSELGAYRLVTASTVRHAECNALMNMLKAGVSPVGATMFCNYSCCINCAIDIVDSGISEFYYANNYRSNDGLEYLKKFGVKVTRWVDQEQ